MVKPIQDWMSSHDPSNALVSVVIPAYNARAYVMEAINSVRAQDYAPLEILLIDDGSKDDTVELVRTSAPEVRIIQQANAGVAAARNRGLHEARGDYICLLDADDGWFPGKLKAQIDYLQTHPEVGLVYHRWLVWKPDRDGVYHLLARPDQPSDGEIDPQCSGWIYPQLLLDCVVHTSTVMMRREIVAQVGDFDTSLINGEDYNYWLRVSRLCEIHKLTGIYSYYRASSNSLTSHPKHVNYGYLVIERALQEWGTTAPNGRSVNPERVQQHLYQLAMSFGYLHYHSGSAELAKQAFQTALKHYPFRWRALLYLFAAQIKAIQI